MKMGFVEQESRKRNGFGFSSRLHFATYLRDEIHKVQTKIHDASLFSVYSQSF